MSTAPLSLELSRRSPRRISLPGTCRVLLAVALASAVASTAEAAPKKQSRSARSEPAESGPRMSKVAVFAFDGDEATNVRKHVVMALTNQGLKVDTSLRPVQTTEEFRDMGATLDLAAYVHGRIKDLPADKAEATIMVRSGVTGRTIATTTITGYRRGLRFDVEEKLWQRVGKVLLRVCKEAKRPRRPVNAPTRIEAGTPL